MIKVMLVDDEAPARDRLKDLLSVDPEIKVTAQAAGAREALSLLKKEKVELVFLDIQMPGMNGLELAGVLSEWTNPPMIVFATAYDQYSLEAFEACAFDYILKPCDPDRLAKTLKRVKVALQNPIAQSDQVKKLQEDLTQKGVLNKLVGHKRNSKEKVLCSPQDVIYFQANGNEVLAFLADACLVMNSTLQEIEDRLIQSSFARTHKSYLVNLDRVIKVAPMFHGSFELTVQNDPLIKVPLSRKFSKEIKKILGGW